MGAIESCCRNTSGDDQSEKKFQSNMQTARGSTGAIFNYETETLQSFQIGN